MTNDIDQSGEIKTTKTENPINSLVTQSIEAPDVAESFDLEGFVSEVLRNDIVILTDDLDEERGVIVPDESNSSIVIDNKHLNSMMFEIAEAITGAIKSKTIHEHPAFGPMVANLTDEQIQSLYGKLQSALESRNPADLSLDEFDINLPLRTISERQIIKDALTETIKHMPINWSSITSKEGEMLDQEADVEFILVQKEDELVLMVAARKGIESVDITSPESLGPQDFPLSTVDKSADGSFLIILANNSKGISPLTRKIYIVREKLTKTLRDEISRVQEVGISRPTPRPATASSTWPSVSTPQQPTTNWVSGEGSPRHSG